MGLIPIDEAVRLARLAFVAFHKRLSKCPEAQRRAAPADVIGTAIMVTKIATGRD